ncbi:MAG TPA: dTDP-4-dehydrorhamnose 3,5-epimerase [Burkholderiales bacterium]|nr:dTDP-4-dehydrorhamnose 3,5-epimerase [Burkholderiales bacterium]
MRIIATDLPGVLLIEPKVFSDLRGYFHEGFNRRAFAGQTGLDLDFVQDNFSRSAKSVLRGLHYQVGRPQGKLIRVTAGEVFDVAVDIRRSSPTFGKHACFRLSAENKRMAWIPVGFAHGFLALADNTDVIYKVTDYWYAEHERTIAWNDPDLAIGWPLAGEPVVSPRDAAGVRLRAAELFD